MNKLLVILTLIAAALQHACSEADRTAWSRFADVPPKGWNSLDGREFFPFDYDTVPPAGRYDLALCIRHNGDIPYRVVWLEVEQADQTGVFATDTVAMTVADKTGHFLGKGSYGLYEVTDTIARGVPSRRGWMVAVRQLNDTAALAGVNNIGVILLKH